MNIEKHTVSSVQDNTGLLGPELDYLSTSLSTTMHAFLSSHVLLIPNPLTLSQTGPSLHPMN